MTQRRATESFVCSLVVGPERPKITTHTVKHILLRSLLFLWGGKSIGRYAWRYIRHAADVPELNAPVLSFRFRDIWCQSTSCILIDALTALLKIERRNAFASNLNVHSRLYLEDGAFLRFLAKGLLYSFRAANFEGRTCHRFHVASSTLTQSSWRFR